MLYAKYQLTRRIRGDRDGVITKNVSPQYGVRKIVDPIKNRTRAGKGNSGRPQKTLQEPRKGRTKIL